MKAALSFICYRMFPVTGETVTLAARTTDDRRGNGPKNHDFKFGVSFTQLRRFWGQDYGDLYLERFKEVFNYATIGMYYRPKYLMLNMYSLNLNLLFSN